MISYFIHVQILYARWPEVHMYGQSVHKWFRSWLSATGYWGIQEIFAGMHHNDTNNPTNNNTLRFR